MTNQKSKKVSPFLRNAKSQNHNVRVKRFLFLVVVLSFSLFFFRFVFADVPVREQNLPLPVWVQKFDSCTDYEKSLENFIGGVTLKTSELAYKAERRAQMRDIQKAREDVNKLVATVYNELKTQQIALNYGELHDTLQSLGIVVSDDNSEEICKSSYHVKAKVGDDEQCVAVAQEARIITNVDDYIYEESRRRAMDGLFCYLGDWRHFPISAINSPSNCQALRLGKNCENKEIWEKLKLDDEDGNKTPDVINDDQHVYSLCEGMRALGKKCAQDQLRDFIKYTTIDKITRKDRTIILAPPATWYTPTRCQIIESTLPVTSEPVVKYKEGTPYTKLIKSLQTIDPKKLNSMQFLDYYTGSKFGNPTLSKQPSDMGDTEYTIDKEMEALTVPEDGFPGLTAKAEMIANKIITEMTDLRKLQYTSGQGLRDATLRIGWQDYDWDKSDPFLGKYEALDSPPPANDPLTPDDESKKPNKVYAPLPCYWKNEWTSGENGTVSGLSALCDARDAGADHTGKTFYFDTSIVIAPISITKSKLDAAIKAQFDLAQKAFSDNASSASGSQSFGECGISLTNPDYSLHSFLPAPWEDTSINLASAINPLTSDSYITNGDPIKGSKDNISYRIPNLPNNYFNVIYNDVFQLYHTSVPDVLAKWFRINDYDETKVSPYNSIYGTAEPINIFESRDERTFKADPSLNPASDPGTINPTDPILTTGGIPGNCASFQPIFQSIGEEQGIDACLLEGIAAAESTCDPSQGNIGDGNNSCGLMQIEVGTSASLNGGKTVSCQELKSNNELSMRLGAKLLLQNAAIIGGYTTKHNFVIGNSFTQSGNSDPRDSRFDSGNDDLIASYNGGAGDGITKKGKKMPFYVAEDCGDPNNPGDNVPAWQCPIKPGEFRLTQRYVRKVQAYQKECTSS